VVHDEEVPSVMVDVDPQRQFVELKAVEPGLTQCGFWFDQNPVPNRLVRVFVAEPPDDSATHGTP